MLLTPHPLKLVVLLQSVAEASRQGHRCSPVGRQSCLAHHARLPSGLCPCNSEMLVLIFTSWLGLTFKIQACPGQTGMHGYPNYK